MLRQSPGILTILGLKEFFLKVLVQNDAHSSVMISNKYGNHDTISQKSTDLLSAVDTLCVPRLSFRNTS